MTRAQLEQHQVWIYLAATLVGIVFGKLAPAIMPSLAAALWPLLAILLYATFTQIPLQELRTALQQKRFLTAALVGNFVAIPLAIAALLPFAPAQPAIQLGLLLVLLVPCTDWFISFTFLGGGSAKDAVALSPIILVLQLILLPFYLPLLVGDSSFNVQLAQREMIAAFIGLIAVPLLLAWLTQRKAYSTSQTKSVQWIAALGWLPVPTLALVIVLIAATQFDAMSQTFSELLQVIPIFVAFLLIALAFAAIFGKLFKLPQLQKRTLAFSYGTRNSFVVLPLALALPDELGLAAAVIVLQSLVELLGMLLFLCVVPKIWREAEQ